MTSYNKFKYKLKDTLPDEIPVKMEAPLQCAFTDKANFEKELSAIFDADWIMVGRAGSIPNPGDYFTANVGRRPIIVIRQNDLSIKAMGNYCLHRYTQLLKDSGNTKSIVCPYHYWSYTLDGQLNSVPHKEGFCADDIEDKTLEYLACEDYLGYIFVSMKQDLMPVSMRLKEADVILEDFGLEDYQDHYVEHHEIWNANWKLICHNFIESYHVTYTHQQSIGPYNPTKAIEYGPLKNDYFTVHSNSYTKTTQPESFNSNLSEEQKRHFYVFGLFPNGLVAVEPNFVWWMALEPISEEKTNARWGVSFSPETMKSVADPEAYIKETIDIIVTATSEDKQMVEGMQIGSNFGSQVSGPMHAPLEIHIKEFQDYISRQMQKN